jgi:hypothetical protein
MTEHSANLGAANVTALPSIVDRVNLRPNWPACEIERRRTPRKATRIVRRSYATLTEHIFNTVKVLPVAVAPQPGRATVEPRRIGHH